MKMKRIERATLRRWMDRLAAFLLWLMLLPLRTAQFLKRHREWVLTGMAMLAVMLVSSAITLRIALHVREVTVPDVTGKTLAEASNAALQSGVGLVIENRFYSTTVPAGRVLSQSPAADVVVRHGWQVRVTESLGTQLVTIPNVVGETVRDAAIVVRRDSLDLGTLARIEAPGEPEMVLAQTPPPNAGVDQPRVNLLVSRAPEAASGAIVLPSLVGLSATAAIHQASELGLVVSGAGNGMVVTAQSPGAGSRAVRGDAVRLTLSGGEGLAGANGTTPVKPVPVGPISIQLP